MFPRDTNHKTVLTFNKCPTTVEVYIISVQIFVQQWCDIAPPYDEEIKKIRRREGNAGGQFDMVPI